MGDHQEIGARTGPPRWPAGRAFALMILFVAAPYLVVLAMAPRTWAPVWLPGVLFSYPVVMATAQRAVRFVITGTIQPVDEASRFGRWTRAPRVPPPALRPAGELGEAAGGDPAAARGRLRRRLLLVLPARSEP